MLSNTLNSTLHTKLDRYSRGYRTKNSLLNPCRTSWLGDVAFYWLPYVERLLNYAAEHKHIRLRFVAVERPIQEVVASYQIKVGPKTNHWTTNQEPCNPSHNFYACFPKYDINDMSEGIARYCSEYRLGLDKISSATPEIIKRGKTSELIPETIHDIFKWLGVAHKDVVLVKTNCSNHVRLRKRRQPAARRRFRERRQPAARRRFRKRRQPAINH